MGIRTFTVLFSLAFIAGCGTLPVPVSEKPMQPQPAAPIVSSVIPPIRAAIKQNIAVASSVKDLTRSNLPVQKPIIIKKLHVQRDELSQATVILSQRAVPAAAAADKAARQNARGMRRLQAALKQQQSRQVQMVLTCGAIAGGLSVLAGIAVLVFMHGYVEGPILIVVGIGIVGLVWFAAAHVALIGWVGAG